MIAITNCTSVVILINDIVLLEQYHEWFTKYILTLIYGVFWLPKM